MGTLYTNIKIFHFREKIDSLPRDTDAVEPPVHIRIKPTNACGHRCRYCAYRSKNLQLGRDMVARDYIPKEKMMEIVDDIVAMGVKAVTFSGGGDPFYYPYLLETVRKLSLSRVKFASLTNGARLHGEIAEIFAHQGIWLRISIDGWDNESYSYYRGVPKDEFFKVMNNMENLKKLGGACRLGVSIIVDRKNSEHVYSLIGRLKDTGVDSIKISPCIVSNDEKVNNEYHRPIFHHVKDQIRNAVNDMADKDFEIFDAYHELDGKFEKEYTWCPYMQILPVIGADLNVYPCQDKAYNLQEGLIGSIKKQRFMDFWFNGKEKFFKINPSIVCNHHCVANLKNKIIFEYLEADRRHLEFV